MSEDEILDLLASNLCRCTGYQNIIKAVRNTAAEMRRARA
jgi:carbon-monoxide dehydrogenase small subunit